jgi:hypothetical protein
MNSAGGKCKCGHFWWHEEIKAELLAEKIAGG